MALTVSCKRLPDEMPGGEDEHGRRTYTDVYEVDQTDGGALAAPVAVAIAAQSANAGPDIIPLRGQNYSYGGSTDLDSYALRFGWKRPFPKTNKYRVHVNVDYGPADGFNPGRLSEPNPLLWQTEYWLEWTEEQVPVKEAKNVDDLTHIGRPPFTLSPITNAAGEEPVDPTLKLVRYPILCAQKAYATLNEIVALNTVFQETTNNGTYFGAAARQAKYLGTESGHITRTQGYSFYLGVTKIWFKKLTWDLKIMNIGFNELVKKRNSEGFQTDEYLNDSQDEPQLFRCMVRDISYNEDGKQVLGDWVPSSEPLKLDMDGTRAQPTLPATNLRYRELEEVNYAGIGIGS
jgi:hypothetical protein